MAYTTKNFKTKAELKRAVDYYMKWKANKDAEMAGIVQDFSKLDKTDADRLFLLGIDSPPPITCFQPAGFGPDLTHFTGRVTLEGPHYPKPHTWYATAELVDGVVICVR